MDIQSYIDILKNRLLEDEFLEKENITIRSSKLTPGLVSSCICVDVSYKLHGLKLIKARSEFVPEQLDRDYRSILYWLIGIFDNEINKKENKIKYNSYI